MKNLTKICAKMPSINASVIKNFTPHIFNARPYDEQHMMCSNFNDFTG